MSPFSEFNFKPLYRYITYFSSTVVQQWNKIHLTFVLTVELETRVEWCIPIGVWGLSFWVPSPHFKLEIPLKLNVNNPNPQNLRWLLRKSTAVKTVDFFFFLYFILIWVSLNPSNPVLTCSAQLVCKHSLTWLKLIFQLLSKNAVYSDMMSIPAATSQLSRKMECSIKLRRKILDSKKHKREACIKMVIKSEKW